MKKSTKEIGGGSLPLATASSPVAAVSSATPTSGGHPRNAPVSQAGPSRTSLKSAGVILIDCDHNTPKYQLTGKPYVCIPQLKGGRLDLGNVQRISDTDYIQWTKKAKPVFHDVILSRRCNPGETAHVPDGLDLALGQNLVLLRAMNPDILYPPFLRWATQGPNWWEQVNQFMNVGAVFTSLKCADIPKFEIDLPSVDDQKRISNILGTLDDKIAINRRINQTLEAMAQALFQSWFVDFDPVKAKQQALDAGGTAQDAELAAMQVITGKSPAQLKAFQKQQPEQYAELECTAKLFPNKLVESELGLVPEGWEIKALARLISLIGGGTPKRSEPTFWNGTIPWYSVKDAPNESDVFVIDTEEHISQKGLNESSTRLLPKGTTIISARGTVGKLALVATPMCMNQSCYGVTGAEGIGAYYNYFNLNKALSDLQQKVHGAVFDTITTSTFETCYQSFAGVILADEFDSKVTPLLERIESNVRSNLCLTELRDSLLPKLLAGELDVSSVEV